MSPDEIKAFRAEIQRARYNDHPDGTKLYLHPDTLSDMEKYSEGTTSIARNFLGMDMIPRDDLGIDEFVIE